MRVRYTHTYTQQQDKEGRERGKERESLALKKAKYNKMTTKMMMNNHKMGLEVRANLHEEMKSDFRKKISLASEIETGKGE